MRDSLLFVLLTLETSKKVITVEVVLVIFSDEEWLQGKVKREERFLCGQ
jgi:hypothetical protein